MNSHRRKIVKFAIVITSVLFFFTCCYIVNLRGRVYHAYDISFNELQQQRSFFYQPIQKIVPPESSGIQYKISFPGYVFWISFLLPENIFLQYISSFCDHEYTALTSPVIVESFNSFMTIHHGYKFSFIVDVGKEKMFIRGVYDIDNKMVVARSHGIKINKKIDAILQNRCDI